MCAYPVFLLYPGEMLLSVQSVRSESGKKLGVIKSF